MQATTCRVHVAQEMRLLVFDSDAVCAHACRWYWRRRMMVLMEGVSMGPGGSRGREAPRKLFSLSRRLLCDAMRCDAMLCDAMRCYAMLCDAM
eukprot:3941920-Rhodomonas_salina.5